MMDCATYRRAVLADPADPSPELLGHRESCADCRAFTVRLMRFESRLDSALRVVPAASAGAGGHVVLLRSKSTPNGPPAAARRSRWLAMAASVLLAVIVAGGLWLSVPDSSLAADVVTHMAEEPQAWRRTDVAVPGDELEEVLRGAQLRLAASAGVVSYASSCGFRGRRVPHLVIQTESGPVTVMVLVHERTRRPTRFDEQGYRGVIVPVAGHGSLAVLTRGSATDLAAVERIASRVVDSIVWTG